ncbi:MAG TPA: hypothetical protein VNL97_03830 [Solirubrobacterales bacterium]|nr:hypothetical protein [Solirubrobacterales bacterium]
MQRLVLALLTASLFSASPAQAVLITINFTVTGASDDPVLGGQTSNGTITFDSSIIPVGGGQLSGDYITSSNFVWNGVTWNKDNTSDDFVFNPDGSIDIWEMIGGGTTVVVGTNDIRIRSFDQAIYSYPGATQTYTGHVTWSYSPLPPYGGAAPEPAGWMLLIPAVLGLLTAIPSRKRLS